MRKCFFGYALFLIYSMQVDAQSGDDFMESISQIYLNAVNNADEAKRLAYELFDKAEQDENFQTYGNYIILKQIFTDQVPDEEMAGKCQERADQLLATLTGSSAGQSANIAADDPGGKWINELYPALFTNTDPDNAQNAKDFLDKNPNLQNFNNYTFVGYAYEKNGNFTEAQKVYQLALQFTTDARSEFHPYSYHANFLSRSGEYIEAEKLIERMEDLSQSADDILQFAYSSEALTSKSVYYLFIGDYRSYLEAADEQYRYFSENYDTSQGCNPFPLTRYTLTAYSYELLGDFDQAGILWAKRDSSESEWINCHNSKFPAQKQYPLSMSPVFQSKTGRKTLSAEERDRYILEAETHYDSYKEYANLNIRHLKAVHLGFLRSNGYADLFNPILDQISGRNDFTEATTPFSNYAFFTTRDGLYQQSLETYGKLFDLNYDWINDMIFTFGEKSFITYFNSKLRDGYQNYHSLVKILATGESPLLPQASVLAYNNLLLTKSVAFKSTQKRKQAFINSNDQRVKDLYEEWQAKKLKLIRAFQKADDPAIRPGEETPVEQTDLTTLQEEVDHLENQLTNASKDFKELLYLDRPDWTDIRKNLDAGEAAVELVRFKWRDQLYYSDTAYYAAYIVKANSEYPEVVYFTSLAGELDNRYYRAYQNGIRFRVDDNNSYEQYWQPVRSRLEGVDKVYFAPDGIFHLINLPTLKNPETGEYLLNEMQIQYVTSTSGIVNQDKLRSIDQAVLVGRPLYKMEKVTASQSATGTRSFVRNFQNATISDLPGTKEEVMAIKEEMDEVGVNTILFVEENATEEAIRNLDQPDVLHIATHGYWSGAGGSATDGFRAFNAMVNSGLLLSGVVNYYSSSDPSSRHDGILTAYEAKELDLDGTELVVLSACETGLGHMDAGEGVYGLQRAFREAGARSVITSLWKVDDAATRDFMITFYNNLLQTGNKLVAFRNAQRKIHEQYKDPYYWGAFILTGV